MDWRPMLIGTAASASFMGLSLVGALAIVDGPSMDRPDLRVDHGGPASSSQAAVPETTGAMHAEEPFKSLQAALPGDTRPNAFSAPGIAHTPPDRSPSPGPANRPVTGDAALHRNAALVFHRERNAPPARSGSVTARSTPSEARLRPRMPTERVSDADPGPRHALGQAQGMMTPSRLRSFESALRLSPEQRILWSPVEQALRQIGVQQAGMLRTGQDPRDAFGFATAMRMYALARPLLVMLREDQKAQVRAQARALGFGAAAALI